MKLPLIAVDGPAGAGKSSTSRTVAAWLGVPYLDTGAMYRAATWSFMHENVNHQNLSQVERHINNCHLSMIEGNSGTRIWVNEHEVTSELRSQELTGKIGPVCELTAVRQWLVRLQRDWAARGFGVIEGRDIGTVVFPDAGLKIYLTASPQVRAERRSLDLGIEKGSPALKKLSDEIAERDRRDSNRSDSPLRPARDAITIDTSDLTFEEQVQRIIKLTADRFALKVYR